VLLFFAVVVAVVVAVASAVSFRDHACGILSRKRACARNNLTRTAVVEIPSRAATSFVVYCKTLRSKQTRRNSTGNFAMARAICLRRSFRK